MEDAVECKVRQERACWAVQRCGNPDRPKSWAVSCIDLCQSEAARLCSWWNRFRRWWVGA